ncbi:glycoside hydrolase family protein [Xylophilus sp. Kf1]|nr:glycoside hydrolase family protein [Xylophilus sp. Kf1]
MKTSADGIAVMHYFEQCRLTAYPDPAIGWARPTIGWGDAGPDITRGMVVTQQWADERFARRLATEFEPIVTRAVKVPLARREFDALVCIVYNVGPGAATRPGRPGRDGIITLANGQPSTLLRMVNQGERAAAAEAFLSWNRAAGAVMLGLRRRRAAERALFLGSSGAGAIAAGATLLR